MPINVYYSFPVKMSFVRNDERLLKAHFKVYSFYFKQFFWGLPYSFLRQFLSILFRVRITNIYVSFFAGYSSFLPAIFARITKRPHLIILGGTDCSSFPEINYGNYRKKILGAVTRFSIINATHLAPVDLSLVDSIYTYLPQSIRNQGYLHYCKNFNTPFTVINIGYDSENFYCNTPKVPNSFLTVGQMNSANFYRKGIDLIFQLAVSLPNATFTIVGNTPGMNYGEVPRNVNILPFVVYEELREIYSTHEFYLQLSIMEGFPSAPCEAMLCECIPVVSAVGAMPEIVGSNRFVLQTKEIDELIGLIENLNTVDKISLGQESRQRIILKYPKHTRMQLISLIEELCSSS